MRQLQKGDAAGALHTVALTRGCCSTYGLLSAIARVQAEAGDMPGALTTVAKIPNNATDRDFWGLLAAARAKSGDVRGALEMAGDLLVQRYPDMPLPSWPGAPDAEEVAAYQEQRRLAHLARDQFTRGETAGALQTIAGLKHGSDTMRLVGRLATARAVAGDIRAALDLAALLPEGAEKTMALADIGRAAADAGHIAAALQIAGGLSDGEPQDQVRLHAALAQARQGDIAGARSTGERLAHAGRRSVALAAVAEAQFQGGHVDEAMRTALSPSSGDGPLRKIAVFYSERGDLDSAFRAAGRLSGHGERAGALRDMAVARIEAGDLAGAERVLRAQDAFWRPYTVRAMAAARARGGDPAGARSWASALPSPAERAFASLGVADGLVQQRVASHRVP
jgi:hypothetical protein